MNSHAPVKLVLATPPVPGAIAIVQLLGEGAEDVLRRATGVTDWPVGRMRLANLAGIDEGLAAVLAPDVVQMMPHGGPRVGQRLIAALLSLGCRIATTRDVDPQQLFPEAGDRLEALMLATLSHATSPLAIELLLDQPARWRTLLAAGGMPSAEDLARSSRLNRLIDPAIVVLAGEPNVGKSTLSNALLGRTMSLAFNMPGTTRDYTAGRIDLGGIVVDWHDTPGIRNTTDAIERKAIDLAHGLMERADLLVAMCDAEHAWPALPREADVFVINKVDEGTPSDARATAAHPRTPLCISALHGQGLPEFVAALRERLVPASDLSHGGPWLFDRRLMETSPCTSSPGR